MVIPKLPKLVPWVRFPSPAPSEYTQVVDLKRKRQASVLGFFAVWSPSGRSGIGSKQVPACHIKPPVPPAPPPTAPAALQQHARRFVLASGHVPAEDLYYFAPTVAGIPGFPQEPRAVTMWRTTPWPVQRPRTGRRSGSSPPPCRKTASFRLGRCRAGHRRRSKLLR